MVELEELKALRRAGSIVEAAWRQKDSGDASKWSFQQPAEGGSARDATLALSGTSQKILKALRRAGSASKAAEGSESFAQHLTESVMSGVAHHRS
mmetsp:Transcript_24443/g.60999  ORF Transcript_24443/g.60999 Transcript_24443/m.60999 type:complete len:95 (+) Transcript_24443:383-667(+)